MTQHASQNLGRAAELREFSGAETPQLGSEITDAALASSLQQACAFASGVDVQAAGVVSVFADLGQAAAREASHDPAHGGRFDLLGGRKFSQSFRAGKDQDRQCGELRRADSAGDILLAHAAQEMNGSGVQAVGDGQKFRRALGGHGIADG